MIFMSTESHNTAAFPLSGFYGFCIMDESGMGEFQEEGRERPPKKVTE